MVWQIGSFGPIRGMRITPKVLRTLKNLNVTVEKEECLRDFLMSLQKDQVNNVWQVTLGKTRKRVACCDFFVIEFKGGTVTDLYYQKTNP